jgi:hypothetical protein
MIHLYWHTDPPDSVSRTAVRWRETMQMAVRIWTPNQLPEIKRQVDEAISGVAEQDHLRHIANVMRWAILAERGGIWADTDVTPLRSFLPLLADDRPWSAAIGTVPTPFVCGGPPCDLWARAFAASIDHPEGTSPEASGGRLLQTVLRPHELVLRSASLFAEVDALGRSLPEPAEGRYSTHQWATSSRRCQEWVARTRRARP